MALPRPPGEEIAGILLGLLLGGFVLYLIVRPPTSKTRIAFEREAAVATHVAFQIETATSAQEIADCLGHPPLGGMSLRGPVEIAEGSEAVFSQARHVIIRIDDGPQSRVTVLNRPADRFSDDTRAAITRCWR